MIKDPIVKGNLKDFQHEYNFINLNEDDAFEHFVNFLVFHRYNSEIFDDPDYLDKINIDNGLNFGIDGIGFMMNNTFIFTEDHIETFKKSSQNFPSLSMDFVFTQAKTSPKFDSGEILKFLTAVKDFLNGNDGLQNNNDLSQLKGLKDKLLSYETLNCINKSNNPNLHFSTGHLSWCRLPKQMKGNHNI